MAESAQKETDTKKRTSSISDSEKGARDEEKSLEVADFGGDSTLPPPPKLTEEEARRLYRKIDLRLMPILTIMYLCSFLDRGK